MSIRKFTSKKKYNHDKNINFRNEKKILFFESENFLKNFLKVNSFKQIYNERYINSIYFDVKFYLIAIMFIIFDIETMFLIPWSVSVSKLSVLGFWSMLDFIFELGVGVFYIWYSGALEWD